MGIFPGKIQELVRVEMEIMHELQHNYSVVLLGSLAHVEEPFSYRCILFGDIDIITLPILRITPSGIDTASGNVHRAALADFAQTDPIQLVFAFLTSAMRFLGKAFILY